MKKRILIGGVIAVTGLLPVVMWFARNQQLSTPEVPSRTASNSINKPLTPGGAQIPTVLSPSHYPAGLAPLAKFIDPKIALMESAWVSANAKDQDFYGKVIDQDGKPVIDATATGTLIKIQGMTSTTTESHTTQSDSDGDFEFAGLHGWQLGVVVKKNGYEMGRSSEAYKAPNKEDKTSPSERAIFTMWRLRGAEPMTACSITTTIPCDGKTATFNLLTGRGNGNLEVTLTRNPVNIDRSKPFNWTLTVGIANGGLMENTDAYPYEAPAGGYQPSITITMSADDKKWSPSASGSYYFKSGQTYGRMTINVMANFQPPPTVFNAGIYANPSGSRNLEYESAKQINQ